MDALEDLTAYWRTLQLQDIFYMLSSFITGAVSLVSIKLLKSFVDSKPDGRKTVIGNAYDVNWLH